METLENRLALSVNLLLNHNPPQPFHASHLTELNGELYFIANNGPNQNIELWKTDGMSEASLVTEIPNNSRVTDMVTLDDQLVFLAVQNEFEDSNHHLYSSDGTSEGTIDLTRRFGEPVFVGVESSLHVENDRVFFYATDYHGHLFPISTDGTIEGTNTFVMAYADGGVYWVAPDRGKQNAVLWYRRDGEPTNRLEELSIEVRNVVVAGEGIYFIANTDAGREVWFSDGTGFGTSMIQDLNPGPRSSNPSNLTLVGDQLYFIADDGQGRSLFSAERKEGAFEIENLGVSNRVEHFIVHEDTIYVLAETVEGFDLASYSPANESLTLRGTVEGDRADLLLTSMGMAVVVWNESGHQLSFIADVALTTIPDLDFNAFLGGTGEFAYLSSQALGQTTIWYTEGTPETTKEVGSMRANEFEFLDSNLIISGSQATTHGIWKANADGINLLAEMADDDGGATYHQVDTIDGKAIISAEDRINCAKKAWEGGMRCNLQL